MEDTGAGELPRAAVTGTLEEKNNNGDDEIRRPAGTHSPLHDATRGLLPESAEEDEDEDGGADDRGSGRARGHSNSDSDSSAVDSDEEEVRLISVGTAVGRS